MVTKSSLAAAIAFAILAVAAVSPALAQTAGASGQDVLGAQPVADAVIVFFKIIGLVAICVGFAMLWTGRHSLSGLGMMAVGVLGVAKTQTIATFLGL